MLGTVLPTRDRKHLVVSSWQERGKPGTFPIEGGSWQPFLTKSGSDNFQGFLYDGLLHPTKNEFYLFTHNDAWPRKTRVYVIDLDTRRETRSFELPSYLHDPFLTPDGNSLYGTDDRNPTVQVHNLEMYD